MKSESFKNSFAGIPVRFDLFSALIVTTAMIFLFTQMDAKTAAVWGWLSATTSWLFLGYVISTGIRAKKAKLEKYAQELMAVHRIHINIFTIFMLIGGAGIYIAIQKHGGHTLLPVLRQVHFFCLVVSGILFALIRLKFTGEKDEKRHRPLAYGFMVFYSISFFTGSYLLDKRFGFSGLL